jgi:hypothetical protein
LRKTLVEAGEAITTTLERFLSGDEPRFRENTARVLATDEGRFRAELLGHLAGIQRALEGQLDVMRYQVSFPFPLLFAPT